MIDLKRSEATLGGTVMSSAEATTNLDGTISLTWLWEIILRTKRLPDNLDLKVLFTMLRGRLRNHEREVRQHALRVLADLLPVIGPQHIDKHMEGVLPELVTNLSHVAPSVRKGTVDVLRIYLKHSVNYNEVLKKLINAVREDTHLRQGLFIAIPYFANYELNEETLKFLVDHLISGLKDEDNLKETSLVSLLKIRSKLGMDFFNGVIGVEERTLFEVLCEQRGLPLINSNNDNSSVILETEIKIDKGPPITMQIHEENIVLEEDLIDERENWSDCATRSPRKVRFGGEIVKMRTPDSENSNYHMEHPAIKSKIPVRVPALSKNVILEKKRLHSSAPELGQLAASKIPVFVRRPSNFHLNNKIPPNEIRKVASIRKEPEENSGFYPSFQVCQPDGNNQNNHHINKDINIWTKNQQVLEEVIRLLSGNEMNASLDNSKLFAILFMCEKEPQLQNRAQEAIIRLISSMSGPSLEEILPELSKNILGMSSPCNIRCAVQLMEKCSSPRRFFGALQFNPQIAEATLQTFIVASRIFPIGEIDLIRATKWAFEAMAIEQKSVRQAVLETLATLAQVAGNSMILETVYDISKDQNNSDEFLNVIRTRLSRRQLPVLDSNWNVRYSKPREQAEFDWIYGGKRDALPILNLHKNTKEKRNNNYWKHNSRHEFKDSMVPQGENSRLEKDFQLVSNKNYHTFEESNSSLQLPALFHHNENSPDLKEVIGQFQGPPSTITKSLSSEQIYFMKQSSESASSRSSRTSSNISTESSLRSGSWMKTSIPGPVHSGKFRHNRLSKNFAKASKE